jgi:outer membrane protein assembly factor BamB
MSLGAVATVGGGAVLLSSLGQKATGAAVLKPLGPAPTPFWTYRSGPLLPAPAAFNAGTALVKTRAGNLVCLDLKDGTRPKWTYRGISQSPTPAFLVSDALVALGSGSTVIGVDPSTGTERFSLDFGADFQFDTLLGKIEDNSVSILGRRFERAAGQRATSTDVILSTDLQTRRAQVIPINAEDRGLDVKPVITPDHFIFIDGLNNVAAATDSGGFAWRHQIGSGSRPAPVALGPTVFAVGRDLVAVDAASGQLRWRVRGDAGFASIAAAGSTIYCTTTTPYGVQAFNAADGSRSWFCRTPPLDLNGTLAACPHAVFVPALENRDGFYAIDAKRGRLLWNFTDGQDTGANAWQLATDNAEHLIAQHFDRTYALPIP